VREASLSVPPSDSLRERKKAKTRAALQQHALRLFREQGYEATTVEQIAAAAEVSPSTFFRYFATKEDCVIYDALDPLIFPAFAAQPPALSPMQALRAAVHEVFTSIPADEAESQRERARLAFSVPELRMRMLDQQIQSIVPFIHAVAKRVGRDADDIAVRTFVGAVLGATLVLELDLVKDPTVDVTRLIDKALAQLDASLPSMGAKLPL